MRHLMADTIGYQGCLMLGSFAFAFAFANRSVAGMIIARRAVMDDILAHLLPILPAK